MKLSIREMIMKSSVNWAAFPASILWQKLGMLSWVWVTLESLWSEFLLSPHLSSMMMAEIPRRSSVLTV